MISLFSLLLSSLLTFSYSSALVHSSISYRLISFKNDSFILIVMAFQEKMKLGVCVQAAIWNLSVCLSLFPLPFSLLQKIIGGPDPEGVLQATVRTVTLSCSGKRC